MKKNKYPPGWDEERVQSVIDYYENQTEDEAVAEAEEAFRNKPMNDQSDSQNELSRVLQKICEIAEKSADGDYIYRGEPECYDKVSSSLYREYPHKEGEHSDIEGVQNAILNEAKAYTSKTDPVEILTELQHFGGKTNLIDFTEDYLIALFFACDGSHTEDGRIVLLEKQAEGYEVKKPRKTINRVQSQKSIFVESPRGFIEPNIVITIPVYIKFAMLEYLRKNHGICAEVIYNDLHGFIRRSAYTEVLKALTCQYRADEARTHEEKHEHYENAIKHYSEVLKLKPDFPVFYLNRGATYSNKGEVGRAIQDYSAAIDLKPNYAVAYYNRGNAYSSKGDFTRAIQDYNTAIDLKPGDASAYYNRGNAYKDKGDFARAIQDYNTAIDLKPGDASVYLNRGVAYSSKGDFTRAIQDYNTAIDLKPNYAVAYYNRGNAYSSKGDFTRAIQDYNTAIDLKPDDAKAYNNRGLAYDDKGDFEKAIQDYNKVIELKPDFPEGYNNRGVAYRNKGDFEKAIQDHNKVIKLRPNYVKGYCIRGKTWLHLKEWKKAKDDLTLATDKGMDIITSFRNDYESVENFEQKNGVQLPKDIQAMLTQQ